MRKLGQNRIDRIFEQGLQSAEAPVSAGVWAGISAQLENSRLRRKLAFYRTIAAASVVLLMGFGAWSLTSQSSGSGTAASNFAMGKALNGNAEAWSNRDCPPGSPADYDDVQGTNLRALRNEQAAYTPIWTAASQYNALSAISTQLSDGKEVSADIAPTWVPQEAIQNLEFFAHILPGRVPNLLPNLAEHDRRSARRIVIQEQGLFAGLLPKKSTEKHKEKEFAFVLDEADQQKKQSRWELGAGFSPDMTFASITPIQQNARSTQILADDPTEANTKRLSPVMAYATGLRATFALNDRFSLRSGISYINRQTSTNQTVNAFGKIDAYQSNLNLSSMEVPVTLRYNLITNEHFDYYVATGVSGTFLLSYENTQVATDGKISARRGSDLSDVMRPSQGSALASTGLRYRIHNNLSLQLEPGLRYGLLTNEYAFSQSRPLSMSLTTGLNYRF